MGGSIESLDESLQNTSTLDDEKSGPGATKRKSLNVAWIALGIVAVICGLATIIFPPLAQYDGLELWWGYILSAALGISIITTGVAIIIARLEFL